MLKLSKDQIAKIDSLDMFNILKNFPKQVEEGIEIGRNSALIEMENTPLKIVILGMGGSAIGGDLLRSYSQSTKGADHLQIFINRGYTLPNFIDDSWLVIASSYSGGTEETLSSYNEAKSRTKNILAITSGGELKHLAKADGYPVVHIPSGLMPRCAIGYSFFALIFQLMRIGAFKKEAIHKTSEAIYELNDTLKLLSDKYSEISDENSSISLAKKLYGKVPVIYSSDARLDVVNLRWKGQIQENSKQLCFGGILPEMNHNEINSWIHPNNLTKQFIVVLLRDAYDHNRISSRFDATKEILSEQVSDVIEIKNEGKLLLTRMFSMIYLADWTSYWLALLNEEDPTPIPLIAKLKNAMK